MSYLRLRPVAMAAAALLAAAAVVVASDEPNFTEDQMKQFLLTAKVVNSRHTAVGVTSPWRLTLSDGNIQHDAAFQSIDERKTNMQFASGRTEMLFRDSYHFNIAAYELAKLLGLDHMMPVTVERKWEGKSGSLSWWLPVQMDERTRMAKKLDPPDPAEWNKQMRRKRVFAQLVYDTDPNLTNLLIGHDWKVYMIDFGRSFRLDHNLESPKNLTHCDRQVLEKLKQLDPKEVEEKTKPHLSKSEVKAVMARRDKIVAHFQKLIAEKGESEVLY